MAGVKGKSGRKSLSDEEKRLRIINKSWDILEVALNSDITLDNKIRIALELCKKNIPQELEHSGEIKGGNTIINIVKNYPAKDKTENRIEERIADTGSN